MSTSNESQTTVPTAQRVPDNARSHCLPTHFGRHILTVENGIYDFLRAFAPDYRGGYWHFYELSNGGFYMAPDIEPLRVCVPSNGYKGTLSADAAGIAVCLFAFSYLSFQYCDQRAGEVFSRHFHQLRNFALQHAEAAQIFAMID